MLKATLRKVLLAMDPVVGEAARWFKGEQGTVRAVCLHAVTTRGARSDGLPQGFATDLDELRAFVELLLRKGYTFITPSQLRQGLDARGSYMLLTFDDGYFSVSLAAPVLKQYGVPMTLFVCPYFIERQQAFWSDTLHRESARRGIPGGEVGAMNRRLRTMPQPAREQWLTEQFGPGCLAPLGDGDRPLTSAELRSLHTLGNVEIGNHTWTHADLSGGGADDVLAELQPVQDYVRDLVGVTPQSMSFPYGFCTPATVDTVRQAGFATALTTVNRRHSVASVTTGDFTVMGRFGAWNHKRPLPRHLLRMRHGALFSDRFVRHGDRVETTLS